MSMTSEVSRKLVAVAALFMAAGCASTNQFVPYPTGSTIAHGKVQMEIKRPVQLLGAGYSFMVVDRGREIGTLELGGTLFWESDTGSLDMIVGPTIFNMGDFNQIPLKLVEGNRYFFEVEFPFFYPFSHAGLTFLGNQYLIKANDTMPEKRDK